MRVHILFLNLDILVQTFLLLLNALIIMMTFDMSRGKGEDVLMAFQLCLGFYQVFVSGVVHALRESTSLSIQKFRVFHLVGGIIYYLFVPTLIFNDQIPFVLFLFIIPQIIAHGYYTLSIIDFNVRCRHIKSIE